MLAEPQPALEPPSGQLPNAVRNWLSGPLIVVPKWTSSGRNWAVEIKHGDAPRFTPSMASALKDLGLSHLWVLYPGDRAYSPADAAGTLPLVSLADHWHYE